MGKSNLIEPPPKRTKVASKTTEPNRTSRFGRPLWKTTRRALSWGAFLGHAGPRSFCSFFAGLLAFFCRFCGFFQVFSAFPSRILSTTPRTSNELWDCLRCSAFGLGQRGFRRGADLPPYGCDGPCRLTCVVTYRHSRSPRALARFGQVWSFAASFGNALPWCPTWRLRYPPTRLRAPTRPGGGLIPAMARTRRNCPALQNPQRATTKWPPDTSTHRYADVTLALIHLDLDR